MAAGIYITKTGKYTSPLWIGMVMMSLGYGLYIDLATQPSLAKMISYQILAAMGTGLNFQTYLLALQAGVPEEDISAATAAFAFVGRLAMAVAVVVCGTIFQNSLRAQDEGQGSSLASKVDLINDWPEDQREAARGIVRMGLRDTFIALVCFTALGLVCVPFIKKRDLKASKKA